MIDDTVGAFCPHGRFALPPTASGRLDGLTFAVKDVIDIAGHVTGAGNPRWLDTHAPASRTAPCVEAVRAAGAHMIGKTITDELAYSLNGDNVHYGTPRNVNAPGRVPGGSSSGSAAAVAADLCSFALGTDSGGSVRIPASHCGIFGIRTTHGRIAMDGIVPFMPSYDTLGWFAPTAERLSEIGAVLLPGAGLAATPSRLVIVEDALAETLPGVREVVERALAAAAPLFARTERITLGAGVLEEWRVAYRHSSAYESWQVLGGWIESAAPRFAPAIAERFLWAKSVTRDAAAQADARRVEIAARVRELVGADGVLCIPTAPGAAPSTGATGDDVEQFRQKAQRLTGIAGLARLPQVSLPAGRVEGCPIGLSLIGPPDADERLMEIAGRLHGLPGARA